ncbi:MAG: TonB-dependent receptor [Amphiplicatus sp.]
MTFRKAALGAASLIAIAGAGRALAADAAPDGRPIEEIVVYGQNVYRDRTADINPTLSYDLEFFQRFEPTTVGEMLKRVPGVVFTSDVLEYDAVQLRGLGSQYTQILVNGRKIPGQQANGSVFVDRIPAELIDRIEIIRSPSSDITGEGTAGTLNVILKEGADLDGAFARIGASYFGDGDNALRYSGAAAVATSGEGYDFWLGVDVQQRRNPKQKYTEFFEPDGTFDEEAEFEKDHRDGTDYSLNSALGIDIGTGKLELNGYAVLTDREEKETVNGVEGPRDDFEYIFQETQLEDIKQKSYGGYALFTQPFGAAEFEATLGYAVYDETSDEFTTELEFESGDFEEDSESFEIADKELQGGVSLKFPVFGNVENKTGVDIRRQKRSGLQMGEAVDVEADITSLRIAPFTKFTFDLAPSFSIEAGVRYESYDRKVTSDEGTGELNDGRILPSFNARWDVTGNDRLRLSVARTMRYPDFDLITPFEEDETPGDDDILVGNPSLDVETSWGFDIGYERRLPSRGVVGLNFFYRDITDLIELVPVGPFGSGSEFSPQNTGDAQAWGVEFDISTPLGFVGLDETAFYANAAWLQSEVTDLNTGIERKLINQPDFVYNVSLVQNFPNYGFTAGASYQKRGLSVEYGFDEIRDISYGGNLEMFLEKRLGDKIVVRFSATNLLDAEKLEVISAYDGDSAAEFAEAIINGDVDGIEIEHEQSSRVYTLTLRAAF